MRATCRGVIALQESRVAIAWQQEEKRSSTEKTGRTGVVVQHARFTR